MNKIIHFTLPVLLSVFITACTSPAQNHRIVGMANPSSQYCVSVGGQSFTKKDVDGNEVGYCKLSDGQIVDEWDFFRKNHKPDDSKPLQ